MELIKETQTFKNEKFQDLRQQKIKNCIRFQFGIFMMGILATFMSFFKPHFDYILIESFSVSVAFGTLERISILFSTSLASCSALYFSCIFESLPVEFTLLGESFERALNGLESQNFDESQFDVLMEKIKICNHQYQKLLRFVELFELLFDLKIKNFLPRLIQRLQDIFKLPMFFGISLLSTNIVFCFYEMVALSSVVSVDFAARIQLVPCVLIEMWMYARPCEQIKKENFKICQRIYNCSRLHNLSVARFDKKKLKKLQSCLNLLAMQANKTVEVKVYGSFTLSYRSYGEVS